MEKIDLKKLQGNQAALYDANESISYQDIEMIAAKINEIIDIITPPSQE